MDADVKLALDHAHDLIAWGVWPHTWLAKALVEATPPLRLWVPARIAVLDALGAPRDALLDDTAARLTRNDVLAALCRAREG